MKKTLAFLGMLLFIILLEISWSSFFSFQERPYFFLFSFFALWVVKKGFLRALPFIILTAIIFEGVIRSEIGLVSSYGVLFSYGIGFLLRRIHLEYGREKIFLSLAAGIGMALYPVFSSWYEEGFRAVPIDLMSGWFFSENMLFGAIFFWILLHLHERFREESLPLASSFLK